MQSTSDKLDQLTDTELVSRLERLVRTDRALSAKLLVHLGEVEARKLYCERGYSTMFAYCRSALGMSEGEASLRIVAARVGRKFPLVVERLSVGAVHLTAIKLLAPHLTQENQVRLLDRARGKTKRQIEVWVADLAPKPDAPARVRKLPEPRGLFESSTGADITIPERSSSEIAAPLSKPPAAAIPSATTTAQPSAAQTSPSAPSSTFALQSPRPRATSTPLGLGRFKLQLTLGQEAQNALDQLVELSRHQNPSGDLTRIVERALIELLKLKMKQRFGQTDAPRVRAKSEPASAKPDVEPEAESKHIEPLSTNNKRSVNSRYIPLSVRRELHARDNGQCTYKSQDGQRCTERGFLEIHHHNTTFARGGQATTENLRIVCRAHNRLLAEQDYGRTFMQEKLHEAARRKQRSQAPAPSTAQP